jgi:hypothetical protein
VVARRGLTPTEARSFTAGDLIIHVVPTDKKDAAERREVDLSPGVATTDAQIDKFFEERVNGTFREKSVPVEQDTALNVAAVPSVREIIRDAAELVPQSQEIAKALFAVQSAVQPDGLLVVSRGSVELDGTRRPTVLVLKLEPQEGANLINKSGVHTPEYLSSLLLTGKTKVFKAAVLALEPNDGDGDALIGCVSDEQTQMGAEFFRSEFLGMRPTRNKAVVTRDFFNSTMNWIDENIADDDIARDYRAALRIEVNSNTTTIDPTNWAQKYLDDGHAGELVNHLTAEGVPVSTFDKDLTWVQPARRRTKLETIQGIKVEGDPEIVAELVSQDQVDGHPVTVIHDQLKR